MFCLFICLFVCDPETTILRHGELSDQIKKMHEGRGGLERKKGAGEFLYFRVNAQKSRFHKNIQRRLLVCRDDRGDEIIFVRSARRSRIFFHTSYLAIFNGYAK